MDHRREWFCPHCNLVYHDKLKARMHIIQHYDNSDGHHQADLLLQTSSRLPEHLSADDCPFCDWSATLRKRNIASKEYDLTVPSRRFMKHLGRHLEEIALFVVPQPEEDQVDSDDIGSNAVHAAQGEDSATNSTLSTFNSKRESVTSIQSQNSREITHEEANRSTPLSASTATPTQMSVSRSANSTAPTSATTAATGSTTHTQAPAASAAQGNVPQANTHLWPPGKKGLLAEIAACWLHSMNPQRVVTTSEILERLDLNPNYVQLCESLEAIGLRFERAAFAREILRDISPASATKVPPIALRAMGDTPATLDRALEKLNGMQSHMPPTSPAIAQSRQWLRPSAPVQAERSIPAKRNLTSEEERRSLIAISDGDRSKKLHSAVNTEVTEQSKAVRIPDHGRNRHQYDNFVRSQDPISPDSADGQDYQTRLRLSEVLNLKRQTSPRPEAGSAPSYPSKPPGHLDPYETKPLSDLQAKQSPPLVGRPLHDNRPPAPHQSLVNERLQAANALRSSSSPSTSVEQSPFKSGSPLAPRQPTWKEFASHTQISNSQSTFQQDLDLDVTAIIAQQANAIKSQESGEEVVPAATSKIPDEFLDHQLSSQNDPTIFVTPADNEHGQAMNIMQQERDAAAQLTVPKNPSRLMTHRPQTISPKDALLDFYDEQYADNALLSDSHDDLSFQFSPVETPSRNDPNKNVATWLGPHSKTVKIEWNLPYPTRHENNDLAQPSRRDYAPESTPFTHDASPFADDKQAQDAEQITEFKDLLQSNDLSPALAERLPSVQRLLETSEANKSRLRRERQLGKAPLTSDAKSYRNQLLRRKTNDDGGS